MGPPISAWSYDHGVQNDYISVIVKTVDSLRVICVNFTFALVFLQIMFSLQLARAGPVVFNMEYSQGPVPLARNIRHLPCVSRRSGLEGVCMFAIDCLKANGTHLGTCIDRFYFGSCCQLVDGAALPQLEGNHIDDNSIDGASFGFVRPPAEPEATARPGPGVTSGTEAIAHRETTASTSRETTQPPMKLSTYQTVSGETSDTFTETSATSGDVTPATPLPTRKPTRPTVARPTVARPTVARPTGTRPQYTQSTFKPRPTKPITTRKPPIRLPSKRPSATRKPLPSPPRLNITIVPQATSSKPLFSRPQSGITYISAAHVTSHASVADLIVTSHAPIADLTTAAPEVTSLTIDTEKVERTTEAFTSLTETTIGVSVKDTVTPGTEGDVPVTTEYPPFATWSSNAASVTRAPGSVTSPSTTTAESWSAISTEAAAAASASAGWVLLSTLSPTSPVASSATSASTTELTDRETTLQLTDTYTYTDNDTDEHTTTVDTDAPEPTTQPAAETTEPFKDTTITEVTTSQPTVVTTVTNEATTSSATVQIATSPSTIKVTTSPSTVKDTTSQTAEPTSSTVKLETTSEAAFATFTSGESTTAPAPVAPTSSVAEFTVNVTLSPPPTSAVTPGGAGGAEGNDTSAGTVTEAVIDTSSAATTVQSTSESVNMSDYRNVCGRRLWQAPTARIVGGNKSDFGMWPWQISLRQYRTSTYLHKCGAALLNENWAITAAHCVEHVPPSELLVRLGEHDLASEDEPYGFAERRVQIVASHPHFDPATFEYDLALLRFYEPVTFQPNILPVCVPDDDDDYVGRTAYVTGWGRLFDEGPLPSVLQEVRVPVINNSACEAMYQAAGYNEHIPNIFICAGRSKGGTDSCEGDSGGPMVVPRARDGRFVLGGVISWGIGCAEPNQPGVYTRISDFRDWINQILQF